MRKPSHSPDEAPRLLLRFAVYAGAAVLLAAVGALLFARLNAGASAKSDLADDAAYISDALGRDDLVRAGFAGVAGPNVQAQLDEFLGPIVGARDVSRASLVAPDGTITYSTDHSLAGKPQSVLGHGTLEQASDAIFVADENGRLTDVNEHATELLGYTREELLERHAMDILSIGDVAQLPFHLLDLEAGKTVLVERPVRRKDGTFLVGDIAAKILDDGRFLTSIRDVTERTQLREAKLAALG